MLCPTIFFVRSSMQRATKSGCRNDRGYPASSAPMTARVGMGQRRGYISPPFPNRRLSMADTTNILGWMPRLSKEQRKDLEIALGPFPSYLFRERQRAIETLR